MPLLLYDEPKRLSNLAKHGLDFAVLDLDFFTAAIVYPARAGRFMAVGGWNGDIIVVVFASLGTEALSVISMRKASRAERTAFHAEQS